MGYTNPIIEAMRYGQDHVVKTLLELGALKVPPEAERICKEEASGLPLAVEERVVIPEIAESLTVAAGVPVGSNYKVLNVS
jgi:hypothetical protein